VQNCHRTIRAYSWLTMEVVRNRVFPISDFPDNTLGILNRFLAIAGGPFDDLMEYVRTYRDRILPNLHPIAYDPGGTVICLSLYGPDRGSVYLWLHEYETDEGEQPTYDNVYFLANSLSYLLASLMVGPE
jgi:hypothetical protein